MYSVGFAYLCWFLSGCGALGLHRFYLGKIPSGILWMCTGGLAMVGSIYDFLTLPAQVREANLRRALEGAGDRLFGAGNVVAGKPEKTGNWRYANDVQTRIVREKESLERSILRQAKEHRGILTVSEVALAADVPLEGAKKALDTLVSKGFAELRVRKSGTLVYTLPEFMDRDEDLEDF
ncbi:MAG: TM2 domain-containing protein [Treponema sp.]|jgi:TM2 domain-containing membrane protein YozV|nr:TM2 domain-containing protein [Treponema sp.]